VSNLVRGVPLTDYWLMLPMAELTIFALGILLIDLMVPRQWKWINAVGALIGVVFATLCLWRLQFMLPRGATGFYNALRVDRFAIYFWYLFLAGTAITILISARYLDVEDEHDGEYYSLLLLSVVGMMCMVAGIDIVLIFVGLELTAISTYLLVGFLRRDQRSNKAAVKCFLFGAFSSGILAYGFSLFYGLSGGTNLAIIVRAISGQNPHNPVVMVALLTTMAGLLFKIAAVPFYQWAPDAYEGAPTSVTGFISAVVMAAGFGMLARILVFGLLPLRSVYTPVIMFVAVASMTVGNFAALLQTNTKRLLAYSSIAHLGYMLLAFVAMGTTQLGGVAFFDGFRAILIYLPVYMLMNLGALAVITSLRQRDVIGDEINDLVGLYRRAPVEAVLMLLFLLSLAGIPPAAGFIGKYYIVLSLVESGHRVLAALAIIFSLLGVYYYGKLAHAVLKRAPIEKQRLRIGIGMRFAVGVTALGTIVIGVYPKPLTSSVNWSLGIAQSPHATATRK
jgi:NADH-quinone oxidoreductase subunit N